MSHNLFRPGGKRPAKLVGRADELNAFAADLEEFRHRGRNLCITGLRGRGKSTLLRAFEEAAGACGCEMLREDVIADYNDPVQLASIVGRQLEQLGARCSLRRRLRMTAARGAERLKPDMSLTVADDVTFNVALGRQASPPHVDAYAQAFRRLAEVADPDHPAILCYDEAHLLRGDRPGSREAFNMLLTAAIRVQEDIPSIMLVLAGLPPLHRRMVAARGNAGREFRHLELTELGTAPTAGAPSVAASLLIDTTHASNLGVEIVPDAAEHVASALHGNPETLQHVGAALLDAAQRAGVASIDRTFVATCWDESVERMDRELFAPRYDNLTPGERQLLRKLAVSCGDRFDEQQARGAAGRRASKRLAELAERDEIVLRDGDAYTFDHVVFGDYLRRVASP